MVHIESEIQKISQEACEMMGLVKYQLKKCKEAMITSNKELALEVLHNEKRVNAYELMIDNDCENLIARFGPVAIDLRFVLATLKINYHLERIGDNVKGIARNVLDLESSWDPEFIDKLEIITAFEVAIEMLDDVIRAYKMGDKALPRGVFEKDEQINKITNTAIKTLADYLETHKENIEKNLNLLLIHRKLERIGDLIKNMAEEVIFYLEADVVKHRKSNLNEDN